MITENEKSIISDIALKYNVGKILLFGSSLESDDNYNDIDLAVEGVPPRKFFRFCADLMFNLSKPIDVVDLSKENPFNLLVKREGVLIYG